MDFFHKRRRCITKISYLNWRRFRCMGSCKLIKEGYGNDNPGAKSQGMKQFMSGAGIVLIATLLVPSLKNLFS
jgi:hypothetical protein